MRRKPWMKMADDKTTYLVGSTYSDGDNGPVAEVYYDKDWLHIVTDSYEGAVMLGIETLPYLQRALRGIAKKINNPAAGRMEE